MEVVKHPATVLSLVNTAAIVGVSAYLYKKTTVHDEDLEKITKSLAATVKKISETPDYQKPINELVGAFHELNRVYTRSRKQLDEAFDIIEEQEQTIALLAEGLNQLGIPIELPQRKSRGSSRRNRNFEEDEDIPTKKSGDTRGDNRGNKRGDNRDGRKDNRRVARGSRRIVEEEDDEEDEEEESVSEEEETPPTNRRRSSSVSANLGSNSGSRRSGQAPRSVTPGRLNTRAGTNLGTNLGTPSRKSDQEDEEDDLTDRTRSSQIARRAGRAVVSKRGGERSGSERGGEKEDDEDKEDDSDEDLESQAAAVRQARSGGKAPEEPVTRPRNRFNLGNLGV